MPQIELCFECGDEVPRETLVRKLRPYGYRSGVNQLLYSSYNSAFWTCDAADAGEVSMGVYADEFRPYVTDGTTLTEARGSQTWTGASGTYRSTVATDLSGNTNLLFVTWVGAYHAATVQEISAVLGVCTSDGVSKEALGTWTVPGMRACWVTYPVASLSAAVTPSSSAVYFYVDITATNATDDWWIDHHCVHDAVKPNWDHLPFTSGTAASYTGNSFNMLLPVLCPKCAPEYLHKPSEFEGDPRFEDMVDIREEIQDL